jgi:hypothetical protein
VTAEGAPSQPGAPNGLPLGSIEVAGNANVGGWRAVGEANYHPLNGQPVPGYPPGSYMVEFQPVPPFIAPSSQPLMVASGQTSIVNASYIAQLPPSITSTGAAQGVRGQIFS